MMIKLAKWCSERSINYVTGIRWFHAGQIPGAYKTPSGTILAPAGDIDVPESVTCVTDSKTMSALLNKIVEFSANKASIADFGAYIMANFNLNPTAKAAPVVVPETNRKTKSQEYIKQFIPDTAEQNRMRQLKSTFTKTKTADEVAVEDRFEAIADDPKITQEQFADIQEICEKFQALHIPGVQEALTELQNDSVLNEFSDIKIIAPSIEIVAPSVTTTDSVVIDGAALVKPKRGRRPGKKTKKE